MLWSRAVGVLTCDSFRDQASSFDRRLLIERANKIGGLKMQLLHSSRLEYLCRIPHSSEREAVDAISGIEKFGAPNVEIIMVSHRWLRPSINRLQAHPDSESNDKALAINEFTKWRREWVKNRHGFRPEIYYWIDYTCIDQSQTSNAIPLLPLWLACCERFLRIESEGYDDRAWCRLEPMLSHVYSFADHHTSIDLDFRCSWPKIGREIRKDILDPASGAATDPEDWPLLDRLAKLAEAAKPANSSNARVSLGETQVKCFEL